jgi:putative methyltransferase (TIGR04325 family)
MLKTVIKLGRLVVPPIVTRPIGHFLRSREKPAFEVVPEGWKRAQNNSQFFGWNTEGVVDVEIKRWEAFREKVLATGPLGFSHENPDPAMSRDVAFHNIHLTFCYVLARAASQRAELSVLDWGGGLGHYFLIAQTMLPGVKLNYTNHEVPMMCEKGQLVCPEINFCSELSCLESTYDVVIANGSLGYFEDWKGTLSKLCESAGEYLFLTRLFVVDHEPTFIILHRTYEHGYESDMLTTVFNRQDVMEVTSRAGFEVVREFAVEEAPYITGAKEQCIDTGWLFKRVTPQ